MKKINFLLFLLLGISISFTSCTKDNDSKDTTTPPVTKKYYVSKTTNEDGTYTQMTYSADKLITKTEDFDAQGNSTGDYTLITYASGKISVFDVYESGAVTTQLSFSYNANGGFDKVNISTDPGTGLEPVGYFQYTYAGTKIAQVSTFGEFIGQPIEVAKSLFTYSGDNVTLKQDYSMNATFTLELTGTSTFEYDTKTNPYRNIGVNDLMGEVQFMSANNVTKITVKDAAGVTIDADSYNNVYEYTAANLPSKLTQTSFDNSTTEVMLISYIEE
jgi:hypothetical protein